MEPWQEMVFDKGCPGERLKTLVVALKAGSGLCASQWFWVTRGHHAPRQSDLVFRGKRGSYRQSRT
jgi:hypothetical protein